MTEQEYAEFCKEMAPVVAEVTSRLVLAAGLTETNLDEENLKRLLALLGMVLCYLPARAAGRETEASRRHLVNEVSVLTGKVLDLAQGRPVMVSLCAMGETLLQFATYEEAKK